jgi:hypothetical protein
VEPALKSAQNAVSFMEQRLGVPFPLKKGGCGASVAQSTELIIEGPLSYSSSELSFIWIVHIGARALLDINLIW